MILFPDPLLFEGIANIAICVLLVFVGIYVFWLWFANIALHAVNLAGKLQCPGRHIRQGVTLVWRRFSLFFPYKQRPNAKRVWWHIVMPGRLTTRQIYICNKNPSFRFSAIAIYETHTMAKCLSNLYFHTMAHCIMSRRVPPLPLFKYLGSEDDVTKCLALVRVCVVWINASHYPVAHALRFAYMCPTTGDGLHQAMMNPSGCSFTKYICKNIFYD